jgi:hypothetical protein
MKARMYLVAQWDRVAAWVSIAVGVVVVIAGWNGISDKLYPAQQLPYILSAGVGSVFLLGIGVMLWLSADMRDEWRKLDRIERAIHEEGARWLSGDAEESVAQNSVSRPARAQAGAVR